MSSVIELEKTTKGRDGRTRRLFTYSYKTAEGASVVFYLHAGSFSDAEEQLKALKRNGKLDGRVE